LRGKNKFMILADDNEKSTQKIAFYNFLLKICSITVIILIYSQGSLNII
jgi:hypothetical protein